MRFYVKTFDFSSTGRSILAKLMLLPLVLIFGFMFFGVIFWVMLVVLSAGLLLILGRLITKGITASIKNKPKVYVNGNEDTLSIFTRSDYHNFKNIEDAQWQEIERKV